MQHYLCFKTDDLSLKIDSEWPDDFIEAHGDNFKCEIEVYFVAEESMDVIDNGESSYARRLIENLVVEEIEIYVDDLEVTGLAGQIMRAQVRQVLEYKPEILLEYAYAEINPENQIYDAWMPANRFIL